MGRAVKLVLAGALVLGASDASRAQRGGIVDPGAADVLNLQRIVVVYPAGPGEDAERNRIAAERKAAFLRASEVDATVAPDDAVDEKARSRDLLVLGWSNRLLRDPALAGVLERSARGFRFLDITESDAELDLLFYVRSPFDPERNLMFWSRIDPERDRFMVLPLIGSHWAVLDDYLPVRQGMLVGSQDWPPRRNPEAERDHRADIARLRQQRTAIRGKRCSVGFDPAVIPGAEVRRILEVRERALEQAARQLGVPLGDFGVRVEVYADVDAKVALTGVPDPVHVIEGRGELHLLRSHAASASPHEEIHLLARRELGPAALTAMYEGLALSHEETYRGMDMPLHAAVLLEKDALPGLADIVDERRLSALGPDARYPAAGLLVRWIREIGGEGAVRRAYGMWRGTVEELATALRREPAGLEDAFRGWAVALAESRKAEVTYLRLMAEAHDHHLVGEYGEVARLMHEALRAKPDDPQALYNLAFCEMRTGDPAAARGRLERLLELDLAPHSRWVILAHFDLGRVFDLLGLREQALAQYRRVLEFPGQDELHILAREAIEEPVTADRLQ